MIDRRVLGVAVTVLVVDQVSKFGYTGRLNYVALTNDPSGGARSWGQIVLGLVLTALVLTWLRRPWWAAGLLAGGLVSNLCDRVVYGGVRDPIAWGPAWWNLADLLATVGLVVCILHWTRGLDLNQERG